MQEVVQHSFDLKELAIAMIKDRGIHEGRWIIGFEFNFGGMNMGSTSADVKPTALVQIARAQLVRQEGAPQSPLPVIVVDAAEVNPAPKSRKLKKAKE